VGSRPPGRAAARGRQLPAIRTIARRTPGRAPRSRIRVVLIALACLVAAVVTVLLTAPASVIDWGLGKATDGRFRLADASGSIWNGRGRLVFVDILTEALRDERAPTERGPAALAGVVLPGFVSWTVKPWPLLLGRLEAVASHESMAAPVTIVGTTQRLDVSAGGLRLPSIAFARLGSPWSAVQPVSSFAASWQALVVSRGRLQGKLALELRDVASALTPVRPLGAYRIDVDSTGEAAQLRMTTLEGPLRLSGGGNWTARGGVRATIAAEADESERLRLQSLLGLLGRREGTRTIIKIGA
jgi:general secretion pathway protein N